MRSRTNCIITSGEVYSWSRECLLQAKLVKDHGWLRTATVVLGIVLRAAARSIGSPTRSKPYTMTAQHFTSKGCHKLNFKLL
jgi:hypothetical protein